jgi:hypothetical protein
LQIEFERGENPDDAYSGVPYEKGGNFILHIGQCWSQQRIQVLTVCQNGR